MKKLMLAALIAMFGLSQATFADDTAAAGGDAAKASDTAKPAKKHKKAKKSKKSETKTDAAGNETKKEEMKSETTTGGEAKPADTAPAK